MTPAMPLSLIALAPIILGPLPQEDRALVVALCLGGEITIPLGDKNPEPERNCHLKACHAGMGREKHKRTILNSV